jgi:hypothetical protein
VVLEIVCGKLPYHNDLWCLVIDTANTFLLYVVLDRLPFVLISMWSVRCRHGRYNGSDCSNISMGPTETFAGNHFDITLSSCDEARIYSCCL